MYENCQSHNEAKQNCYSECAKSFRMRCEWQHREDGGRSRNATLEVARLGDVEDARNIAVSGINFRFRFRFRVSILLAVVIVRIRAGCDRVQRLASAHHVALQMHKSIHVEVSILISQQELRDCIF